MKRLKQLSLLLVAMVTLFATGCTTINPGHAGIVVDQTGTTKGVLDKPVKTGWVTYNPITEDVIEYTAAIQTVQWTQSPSEGKPSDESFTFTNKKGMSINADFSISYSLDVAKIPYFYIRFLAKDEKDLENKFTYGYLHNVARNCINEKAGDYEIEQIMGDNAKWIKDSKECIQADVIKFGVAIDQFGLIGAPRPPATITTSINLKSQAEQLSLQKEMELKQVQADAAKAVAQAEGEAASQIARAKGESEANRIRSASITEFLLRNRALDNEHDRIWRWDGVTPTTVLSPGTGVWMARDK